VLEPFPPFPELPDDAPLIALKNLRSYIRDVVNSVFFPIVLAVTITALLLAFALGCLFFGFDTSLSWAVDLVPFTFAVISVVVSVKTLRDEHHNIVVAFVLFLGAAGTVVIHYAKARADFQHQVEMGKLDKKLDSVDRRNSQLLDIVLKKPELTEAERREAIRKVLLNRYIVTHDNISPGLLSGIESPPAEWMNKQLGELGEKWKVEDKPMAKPIPQTIQVVQPEKKSHIEASFEPVNLQSWPITKKYIPIENGKVEISLTFMPKENLAKNATVWLRLCDVCSYAREPSRFQIVSGHIVPTERMMKVGDLYPNSAYESIQFAVVPPPEPSAGFKVGLFFACENCDPPDPDAESTWLIVYTKPGILTE
jgi:hypothetical protein